MLRAYTKATRLMKRKLFRALPLIYALCLQPLAALSQPPPAPPQKRFELTVDSIMRGPGLVGYVPTEVRWSRDSRRVFFRWKRAGEPRLKEPDTYVAERAGGEPRKLSEEEAKRVAPPTSGDLSKDKRLTVFADEGDIFLYDHERGERRRLTETTEAETNPRFTRDNRRVYFTRQNNLYLLSLDGGPLTQLTDIRAALGFGAAAPQSGGAVGTTQQQQQRQGDSSDAQRQQGGGGSQDVLKREERELLEAVRERAEKREEDERRRKARERRRPFNLAAGQSVQSLQLSPDGAYVVAALTEAASGARSTIVPNYVTESAYTEDIPSRPKVGDPQTRSRVAVLSVETGEAKWVNAGLRAEAAPIVRTRTEANATEQAQRERGAESQQQTQGAQQQSQQAPPRTGQQQQQQSQTQTEATQPPLTRDRDVQLFAVQWSEDGRRAAMLARAADNKERWVLLLDPATGRTRVLASTRDEAWVNGPGAFVLGWTPDSRRVYFVSERDGFAHLYAVAAEGGEPAQLTRGRFEVSDVRLSEDKTKFYFTSSEGSFFERHLYSMPIAGGARARLTTMPGNNQAEVSPDDSTLAVIRSYSNQPPELYLAPNHPGSNGDRGIRQVTKSPVPEFFTHNWIDPPVVSFKARDGATVHARLYKPQGFRRGGPAVIFVHGAGYLQNVHKWWSNYYREYMFHHLLMERGYAVLDIDYRGSAGYGRDWRTGIYRFMGGKDLTDHFDAAEYLAREHGADPKRLGIYGGSYGGFITLMAMFTAPDAFAAGAALRPVTDWAHYNHPYTSNILNLPQSDREAYERSSPIYHAQGLKGALLICHGMVDTNVHFQDSVRLAQRLIELRKENWELAAYPVEDHAFERASSWADQYKRILKLFETNLRLRGGGGEAGR